MAICKWKTGCARCGTTTEEGDELFFVNNLFDEREKICSLCAQMDGLVCACGNQKKQEHPTCYDCKILQEHSDGLRCASGKKKTGVPPPLCLQEKRVAMTEEQ
jgi:hypothetical protein